MFQNELQNYLLRLASEKPKPLDLIARVRSAFLDKLRDAPPQAMRRVYDQWNANLDDFVEFAANSTHVADAFKVVLLALENEFGIPFPPTVEGLEAERVVREFGWRPGELRTYASENLLVTRDGGRAITSRLGRAFLGLTGADAVRWLLLVESERSTGDFDDWRASPALLRELVLDRPGISQGFDTANEELYWPYSRQTLARLTAMGVCHHFRPDDAEESFQLAAGYRTLVTKVVQDDPWRAVVRAQLGDHVDSAVGTPTQRTARAVEVTRVITHEIRNALVPARHYLDQSIALGGNEVVRLQKVHNGVVRVLKFVDELVSISEKVDSSRVQVGVDELVGEAKALLDGAERVSQHGPALSLKLPREPLTRALRNVIQNALQASEAEVEIRWTATNVLRITVDDAGPGVPPHLRERIFADGYTTRPNGTGLGLAMSRQLLTELGGGITCEQSILGGARFVLALPLEESP